MDIGRSMTPASVENDHIVDGVQYNSYEEAMAAYWGWYATGNHSTYNNHYGDGSPEGIEAAIRKYAQVIALILTMNRVGAIQAIFPVIRNACTFFLMSYRKILDRNREQAVFLWWMENLRL